MFYVNKDTILDAELLKKMFNRFNIEVAPSITNYKNYYDGIQAILNKSYSDQKTLALLNKKNCY